MTDQNNQPYRRVKETRRKEGLFSAKELQEFGKEIIEQLGGEEALKELLMEFGKEGIKKFIKK